MSENIETKSGLDRRQFLRLATSGTIVAAGGVWGCGGGGGDGAPINPGGQTVSETSRQAVMDSAKTMMENMAFTDFEASKVQIRDFLIAKPEIEQARVTDGGVVSMFKDGIPYHIILSRLAAPGEDTGPDSGRAGRGTDVPKGTLAARLVNAMGNAFRDEAGLIAPAVSSKDYAVVRPGGAIESLRNFGAPAFFYMSAHGDETDVPVIQNNQFVKDSNGDFLMEKAFALSTSTPYNEAAKLQYLAEILRGEVAAGSVLESKVNGKFTFADKLLITTRWVKRYWNFSPNSLIWISACSSNGTKSQDFVSACLSKAGNKALYVGWTDFADGDHAVQVTKFVIDRLLGANLLAPKESPDQRSFDFVQVYNDLRKRGLHSRPTLNPTTGGAFVGRNTEIIFTQGSASTFGLLAPSIEQVLIDEYAEKAILLGTFGEPDPSERAVLIGGIEAQVAAGDWTPTKIKATLPQSGPGSAGDVVVIVRAHKSNVRRITTWKWKLRYKWTDERPALKVAGTFDIRFRADIGEYRTKPAEDPKKPFRSAYATKDSQGSLTASGSVTQQNCTTTWSDTADFQSPANQPVPANIVAAYLDVDTKTHNGFLGLAFGSLDPKWFTMKIACTGSGAVTNQFAVAALGADDIHEYPDPTDQGGAALPIPTIPFQFGQNFAIAAGVYEFANPHIHWDWDAITPEFLPDDAAARSAKIRK
jgi:hypothetical protein